MRDNAGSYAAIVEPARQCGAARALPCSLVFTNFELQSSMRMHFVATTNCANTIFADERSSDRVDNRTASPFVCYTVGMDDTPGLGRPQQDDDQQRHTLTVHEVGERLTAAGVPRSERQIKRYCESGFLDAKKVPGPTGDQWFVAPAALPKLIGDLQQWQMQRAGRSETRPATTEHVTPEKPINENADTPGLGRPQQAMPDQHKSEREASEAVTSSYVTQLETRIDEKDQVIGLLKGQLVAKDQQITDLSTRFGNLSDRFADTQKLLGAMQRMFAPLLGQGDPYSPGDKPDVPTPTSSRSVDNEQPAV